METHAETVRLFQKIHVRKGGKAFRPGRAIQLPEKKHEVIEPETESYVGPLLSSELYQVRPSEMMKHVRKEIQYLGIAR